MYGPRGWARSKRADLDVLLSFPLRRQRESFLSHPGVFDLIESASEYITGHLDCKPVGHSKLYFTQNLMGKGNIPSWAIDTNVNKR